jgi:hypothetical protein
VLEAGFVVGGGTVPDAPPDVPLPPPEVFPPEVVPPEVSPPEVLLFALLVLYLYEFNKMGRRRKRTNYVSVIQLQVLPPILQCIVGQSTQ